VIAQISAAGAKSLREIARALDARGVQRGSWREVDSDASQRSRAPSRFEVTARLPPAEVVRSHRKRNWAKKTKRRFGSMLLKKSLSTADQNFSRPLMRFSDKNVRDLVS